MKLVVLDGYVLNPGDLTWEPFNELAEVTIYDRTPEKDIVKRIGNAEMILTNKTLITKEVLEQCPNLRYVGVLATGYNVVDTAFATEKGIVVTNIPAYSTQSVVQLVFALLLEICHNVGAHSVGVYEGKWQNSKDFSYWEFPLIELVGKTMGIIGYGEIGQSVAHVAKAFGMKVIAYNHRPKEVADNPATMVGLDELYAWSDVISLHVPLFPETDKMINKEAIAKMKSGAILINTARGGVINEQDVADALNANKLYAAAVDVVTTEPISSKNPLLDAKNCYITPHIAWAPIEARRRLIKIAEDNIAAFLAEKPINVVN